MPTPSDPSRLGPTPGPEPIRPIVRRVIVAMPDEACSEPAIVDLQDPFIRSMWGEVVVP